MYWWGIVIAAVVALVYFCGGSDWMKKYCPCECHKTTVISVPAVKEKYSGSYDNTLSRRMGMGNAAAGFYSDNVNKGTLWDRSRSSY